MPPSFIALRRAIVACLLRCVCASGRGGAKARVTRPAMALAGALAATVWLAAPPAVARGGPAPPEYYYPPTAHGDTATMHRGLPDPVVAALGRLGLPLGSLGLFVQAVDQPLPLLSLNAEQPFMLASTAKVVTTLAAFDLLGPAYRWRTEAHLLGTLQDGRLDGDLLIVGGGNARLSSEDLLRWFRDMRAQGLSQIGGNIVLDRLAFQLSERDQALAPRPDPERPHHSWPDALSLNDGVLRVHLQATPAQGAALSLEPPLDKVTVLNQVAPGRGCTAQAQWAREPAADGSRQLKVTGMWGPACGQHSLRFALMSDSDLTARAVAALWAQAGGQLGGEVLDRPAQASPEAYRLPFSMHLSERLPMLVRDINKHSDNMAARALMLSLSPGFPSKAATPQSAQVRVQQWLRTRGVPAGDIDIDTGSGLSRAERGKPRALVQLLRQAWHDRNGRPFVDSLPIAGVDGTVVNRWQDSPAKGRAHLKTGSLLDVRAIAGFVRGKSGRVYAMSALINHPDAPAGTALLDLLVEWVVDNG